MNYIETILFKDTEIQLNGRHLILTGNNGSGKTYILNNLRNVLTSNSVDSITNTKKEDKKKLIDFLEYAIEKFEAPLRLDQDDINLIHSAINEDTPEFTSLIQEINILLKLKYNQFSQEKEEFFKKNIKISQKEFIIETIKKPHLEKYFHYYSPEFLENLIKEIDNYTFNFLKNKKDFEVITNSNNQLDFIFFDSSRVPSMEGLNIKITQSYDHLKKNPHITQSPNLLEAYLVSIKKHIDEVIDKRLGKQTTIWSVDKIQQWFIKVENDLKYIFENESIELTFSKETNQVLINLKDIGRSYTFEQLSSGFKAIFYIYSALLMKAEKHNTQPEELTGITIVDEIDVHLHISLQKKILPFLIKAFPKMQFIVSTHSPFVITSTDKNTVVYDLSSGEFFGDDLSRYSYESVIKGLFHVEIKSEQLESEIKLIAEILNNEPNSYIKLREILKNISPYTKQLDVESKSFYYKALNHLLDNQELGDLDV